MTQDRKNEIIRAMIGIVQSSPIGVEELEGMIELKDGEELWEVFQEFCGDF